MKRMQESELNEVCAKYGGRVVDERFKGGTEVKRILVMNMRAHGFYIGARFYERLVSPSPFRRLFPHMRPPYTDEKVETTSVEAADWYIKKSGYRKVAWNEQMLIKASVSTGFIDGFRWRQDEFKKEVMA